MNFNNILSTALHVIKDSLMMDLVSLQPQLKLINKDMRFSIFINSERDFGIIVEGPLEFQAYVPKIYLKIPIKYSIVDLEINSYLKKITYGIEDTINVDSEMEII